MGSARGAVLSPPRAVSSPAVRVIDPPRRVPTGIDAILLVVGSLLAFYLLPVFLTHNLTFIVISLVSAIHAYNKGDDYGIGGVRVSKVAAGREAVATALRGIRGTSAAFATAYGVLLTSYRAKIPVVGFSEGLVKAGALLALYSSGRQQGKQGAEIANRILAGDGGLPAPQYPTYFTVRVNSSVARSLGIQMEEEATMAAALAARSHVVGDAREPRPADASGTQRRGP